jgi:hypothetical protein
MRSLLLLLLFVCSSAVLPRHDYYLSVSRLEYDDKAGDFEMSVWFFADDLALALSERSGKEIDWKPERKAQADSLLVRYLEENLYLLGPDQSKQPMVFVGSKEEGELIYAYLKWPAASPEAYAVQFVTLCELFEAQRNLLHYKHGSKRRTLYFSPRSEPQILEE